MEQYNIQTCIKTIDGLKQGKYYLEKGYSYYDHDECFYDPYGICEQINACIEVMRINLKLGNYEQVYHIGFQLVYNGIKIVWEDGEELEWNALWEVGILDEIDELERLLYEAIYHFPLEDCLSLILKVEPYLNYRFYHLLAKTEKKYHLLLQAYCRYYCMNQLFDHPRFDEACEKLGLEELYMLVSEFDNQLLYNKLLTKVDEPLFLDLVYPLLYKMEAGNIRAKLAYACGLLSDNYKVKQKCLLMALQDDFCLEYYLILKYELNVEAQSLEKMITKDKLKDKCKAYYEICICNNLISESLDEIMVSKYQCTFDETCVCLIGFIFNILYIGNNKKIINNLNYGYEQCEKYLKLVRNDIKLDQEIKAGLLMKIKDSMDYYLQYICDKGLWELCDRLACYLCCLSDLLYEAKLVDNYLDEVRNKYLCYRKLNDWISYYML